MSTQFSMTVTREKPLGDYRGVNWKLRFAESLRQNRRVDKKAGERNGAAAPFRFTAAGSARRLLGGVESDNRISRILFKLAVEQAIAMNVIAATNGITKEQLRSLRGTCVQKVKKTHGVYSFDDAYDFQKG